MNSLRNRENERERKRERKFCETVELSVYLNFKTCDPFKISSYMRVRACSANRQTSMRLFYIS